MYMLHDGFECKYKIHFKTENLKCITKQRVCKYDFLYLFNKLVCQRGPHMEFQYKFQLLNLM